MYSTDTREGLDTPAAAEPQAGAELSESELDRLQGIATSASDQPWCALGSSCGDLAIYPWTQADENRPSPLRFEGLDRLHIAACDPRTVLALIAQARRPTPATTAPASAPAVGGEPDTDWVDGIARALDVLAGSAAMNSPHTAMNGEIVCFATVAEKASVALRRYLTVRHPPPRADAAVAEWITSKGFATGHGDTITDMLDEFWAQLQSARADAAADDVAALRLPRTGFTGARRTQHGPSNPCVELVYRTREQADAAFEAALASTQRKGG